MTVAELIEKLQAVDPTKQTIASFMEGRTPPGPVHEILDIAEGEDTVRVLYRVSV